MATIPVRQAANAYDARKLHEVFRTGDVPSIGDDAAADPSPTPAPEAARTTRFRRELDRLNMSAITVLAAGLVLIVSLVIAID
jgi:hypothetical protein